MPLHAILVWKDALLAGVAGDKNPSQGLDLNRGGDGTGAVGREENFEKEPAAPPLVLPGAEPTSESPESSPSPSGCVARLDSGSSIRRYSGRGSEHAGGAKTMPLARRILHSSDKLRPGPEQIADGEDLACLFSSRRPPW